MAKKADSSRFIFRGNAMPFGGRVISVDDKPVNRAIPGAPTAGLTVVGGFSRGAGRGSSFMDAFKWGATLAEASGEMPAEDRAITTVTSSIADVVAVNDPIVFEADLLRAVMVSDHPREGQPSIVPKEVVFGGEKGIVLDGKPVRVIADPQDFQDFPTFDSFEKQYRKDPKFFKKYYKGIRRVGRKGPEPGERLPRVSGYVCTTIVQGIVWGDQRIRGNVLTLEGFGRIYFGELLMNEYNRRLTMVRLRMGSKQRADVGYGEADPNGSWF